MLAQANMLPLPKPPLVNNYHIRSAHRHWLIAQEDPIHPIVLIFKWNKAAVTQFVLFFSYLSLLHFCNLFVVLVRFYFFMGRVVQWGRGERGKCKSRINFTKFTYIGLVEIMFLPSRCLYYLIPGKLDISG